MDAFIAEDGPLVNPDHVHLWLAKLGFIWTNCENKRRGNRVIGQAELVSNAGGRSGLWQRGRSDQQLLEWFDGELPDFLITLDALYCESAGDAKFCALVDHELYHCAQATDAFGMPAFWRESGLPKFAMRSHDVEEFVGVVRRFGIEAAGEKAVDMVVAAAQQPSIGPAKLAGSCGTCLRLAA